MNWGIRILSPQSPAIPNSYPVPAIPPHRRSRPAASCDAAGQSSPGAVRRAGRLRPLSRSRRRALPGQWRRLLGLLPDAQPRPSRSRARRRRRSAAGGGGGASALHRFRQRPRARPAICSRRGSPRSRRTTRICSTRCAISRSIRFAPGSPFLPRGGRGRACARISPVATTRWFRSARRWSARRVSPTSWNCRSKNRRRSTALTEAVPMAALSARRISSPWSRSGWAEVPAAQARAQAAKRAAGMNLNRGMCILSP